MRLSAARQGTSSRIAPHSREASLMTTYAERRGLGRGLGELFQRTEAITPARSDEPQDLSPADPPTSTLPVPDGSYFAELPVRAITPNPRQPRTVFDEDALA